MARRRKPLPCKRPLTEEEVKARRKARFICNCQPNYEALAKSDIDPRVRDYAREVLAARKEAANEVAAENAV